MSRTSKVPNNEFWLKNDRYGLIFLTGNVLALGLLTEFLPDPVSVFVGIATFLLYLAAIIVVALKFDTMDRNYINMLFIPLPIYVYLLYSHLPRYHTGLWAVSYVFYAVLFMIAQVVYTAIFHAAHRKG